jgi:twitching motility protein PilT
VRDAQPARHAQPVRDAQPARDAQPEEIERAALRDNDDTAPSVRTAPRTATVARVEVHESWGPEERAALERLLRAAVEAGASDLHLHSGAPARLRRHGALYDHGSPLEAARVARLLAPSLRPEDRSLFAERGEHDYAFELPGVARFRVNAYRQLRGVDAVFRVIPPEPPSLATLGLPNALARFTTYHQGMLLVTGPTRCGKSSTLAALVNLINEERPEHILTIEDPIEYVHPSKRCVVNQRSVRRHTESFARALRAALREDPDVIVIGELRDRETIALALTAAETGHFVLGTMHTDNSIRTLNRLVGAFPPEQQDQVRAMLSTSLKAVLSQRLLPTADEQGLVVAMETLVVNRAIGNLLRESKTVQIRSLLQTGAAQGMELLEQSLARLVVEKRISREEALRHAEDPKLIPR